jgi:hypothetical protein
LVAGRLVALASPLVPYAPDALRVSDHAIWEGTFDGRFGDRRHALAVFAAHAAAVRQAIDPDRLLVFDVREGWPPLCAFLGVSAPAEPFPHLNDRAAFGRRVGREAAPLAAALAAGLTLTAGGVALVLATVERNSTPDAGGATHGDTA